MQAARKHVALTVIGKISKAEAFQRLRPDDPSGPGACCRLSGPCRRVAQPADGVICVERDRHAAVVFNNMRRSARCLHVL